MANSVVQLVFLLCTSAALLTSVCLAGKNESLEREYQDLFKPPGPEGRAMSQNVDLPPMARAISNLAPESGFFNSFSPNHMEAVQKIRTILGAIKDKREALRMSQALRDRGGMNLRAWFIGFTGYSYTDPDLLRLQKPDPVNIMPDIFINYKTIDEAYQEWRRPPNQRKCAIIDERIGADNGNENILWYFRENIWVNTHHWYFHVSNPAFSDTRNDRRGELFYYMHHEILARYNADRLSNGLSIVKAFEFRKNAKILEGYKAHLRDEVARKNWTDRMPNLPFSDALHEHDPALKLNVYAERAFEVKNLILKAIENGFLVGGNGKSVPINHLRGIDTLGDVVEASKFSVNPDLYLRYGVHGSGHVISSVVQDPNYNIGLPPGVMGDTATAMRDIFFYRWHQMVDDLFTRHKSRLQPYELNGGDCPLLFRGISINNLRVESNGRVNQLTTFWNQRKFPLGRGLDFNRPTDNFNGDVHICAKHLDHEDFSYSFDIDAKGFSYNPHVTVRIFMAPRFWGNGQRFTMNQQRLLFFAMDAFRITLRGGKNSVTRDSKDSTLTNPSGFQNNNKKDIPFCGCGWPHHMLLPKGNPKGMIFDLFVMVSDAKEDEVNESSKSLQSGCRAAPIMCGTPNQLYPFAKPMGYPFDRRPYKKNGQDCANLEEYVKGVPNMATVQVKIQYSEKLPK